MFRPHSPRTNTPAFRRHQRCHRRRTRLVPPHPFPQHIFYLDWVPLNNMPGYLQVTRNAFLRSFALCKTSTRLLSCSFSLFRKKHRGWGREQVINRKPRRMNAYKKPGGLVITRKIALHRLKDTTLQCGAKWSAAAKSRIMIRQRASMEDRAPLILFFTRAPSSAFAGCRFCRMPVRRSRYAHETLMKQAMKRP